MRLNRQFVDLLAIPGEADRNGVWMVGEPAVIMSATLTQTCAIGREADQRDNHDPRYQLRRVRKRLEQSERANLKVFLLERIGKASEFHRSIARFKTGKGQFMPALEEELGIRGCGGLVWVPPVQTDGGAERDKLEERRGRSMEDQSANIVGQGLDMGAARGAQLLAEICLGHELLAAARRLTPPKQGGSSANNKVTGPPWVGAGEIL